MKKGTTWSWVLTPNDFFCLHNFAHSSKNELRQAVTIQQAALDTANWKGGPHDSYECASGTIEGTVLPRQLFLRILRINLPTRPTLGRLLEKFLDDKISELTQHPAHPYAWSAICTAPTSLPPSRTTSKCLHPRGKCNSSQILDQPNRKLLPNLIRKIKLLPRHLDWLHSSPPLKGFVQVSLAFNNENSSVI